MCSPLRKGALALALIFAAVPAWAQYDAITREAQKDPFILVRLAALLLESPEGRGEALAGLIEAELARGQLKDALEELGRIEDGYWRAKALHQLARYNVEKDRKKVATQALNDAAAALKGRLKEPEAVALMSQIALSHAMLGNASAAIAASNRIPQEMARIQSLLDAGLAGTLDEQGAPIRDLPSGKGSRAALIEAYRHTKAIKGQEAEVARLLLFIGQAQSRLNDHKNAAITLGEARRMIQQKTFSGRDEALANLAAAETHAGDQTRAVRLVRSISDPERRVRAVGSVARAIAEKGNMDAAVTLFTLAVETTDGIDDKARRHELLTHLVVEQSRVGRLADAFKTAGLIREPQAQADTLFEMGKVLLQKKKYEEALKLTDFVPYLGLRGQILADVAHWTGSTKGDPVAASALLANALQPLRGKPNPDQVEITLEKVLDTQIEVGDPKTAEALFDRAKGLIQTLPGALDRVRLLTLLARAHARSDDQDQAEESIKAARRITFDQRQHDAYPRSAARIVEALIATERILEGFNAAARIPEVELAEGQRASQAPRNRALKEVAEAAARAGKPQLAIRAARKIRDPASQAAALAAVARGMAQAE